MLLKKLPKEFKMIDNSKIVKESKKWKKEFNSSKGILNRKLESLKNKFKRFK